MRVNKEYFFDILRRIAIAAWAIFFTIFSILFITFNLRLQNPQNSISSDEPYGSLQSLIEEEIEEKIYIEEIKISQIIDCTIKNNNYSFNDSTHAGYTTTLLRPPSFQYFS
jgi:hypothetical protein